MESLDDKVTRWTNVFVDDEGVNLPNFSFTGFAFLGTNSRFLQQVDTRRERHRVRRRAFPDRRAWLTMVIFKRYLPAETGNDLIAILVLASPKKTATRTP